MKKLDDEYLNIIKDIINKEEFSKLKECGHHGINRYEHSVKVSYYAYKYAKKLNIDYVEATRAGLLHDFFITERMNSKQKFISTFNHPKKALDNASNLFAINEKEADIILSHMFPFGNSIPKYKESWLVVGVDKILGSKEFLQQFRYSFKYAANLCLLLLLNFIK